MSRDERLRAFVGVPIGEDARALLLRLQERLRRTLPEEQVVKWERAANFHITLQFLGDIDVADVDRVASALRTAIEPAAPASVGLFGPRGFGGKTLRTIVVEAGPDAAPLHALHGALSAALERLGFSKERRPYRPHVTVGRVRRNRKLRRSDFAPVASSLEGVLRGAETAVGEVVLYRSVLSPAGATYSRLATLAL